MERLPIMMAPILSFLAEEVYSYKPEDKRKESVFLENFPTPEASWNQADLLNKFDQLIEIRSEVSKVLEPMRKDKIIGASIDAEVTITGKAEVIQLLESYRDQKQHDALAELFIVSKVTLETKDQDLSVSAVRSTGEKCPRCWLYTEKLVNIKNYVGVCGKCEEAL